MFTYALLLASAQPAVTLPPPAPAAEAGIVTTASGVRLETLKAGTGPRPAVSGAVLVTYEGRLANGTVFNTATEPVAFGVQDVVPGFAEGLLLMNAGGTYRLRIPAALAYGAEGAGEGAIPPNSDLEFTVNLLDVATFEAAPAAQ
jgi:FKBP-type peptidyl-prolyl cis-trans isomerase FkpA